MRFLAQESTFQLADEGEAPPPVPEPQIDYEDVDAIVGPPVNPPRKRKWNRALRDHPSVKKPRRAALGSLIAFDSNNNKSTETLRKYRTALNFVWRVPKAKALMISCGFKAPGEYLATNQHTGLCFALPREVPGPSRFSDVDAGWILRHCYEAGGTVSQCQSVSKLLSYAYQLRTGEDGNFKWVKKQRRVQKPSGYGPPTQVVRAIRIVEPESVKTTLTTEWTHDTPMPYLQWNLAYILTHDWVVLGMRSQVDLMKIKKSRHHFILPSEGWMYTQMFGGRAKIEGTRGSRPWKVYRQCLCPGGRHRNLPADWADHAFGDTKPTWCTTCPLTCYQVIRASLADDDYRLYPRYIGPGYDNSENGIGRGPTFILMRRFLDIQGGNPDDVVYDKNMGRKSLGKLCDTVGISYPQSFEIHGDLWKNWKQYQDRCINDRGFQRRVQSADADTCLKALRKLARWFGRGREVREDPDEVSQNQLGKLIALKLRKDGHGAEVNRILDNP